LVLIEREPWNEWMTFSLRYCDVYKDMWLNVQVAREEDEKTVLGCGRLNLEDKNGFLSQGLCKVKVFTGNNQRSQEFANIEFIEKVVPQSPHHVIVHFRC
jgi:hypothetical protein